jgi:RNA polymerase sigma-70 factor (ECF subfamily)
MACIVMALQLRVGAEADAPHMTGSSPGGDIDSMLMMRAADGDIAAFEELVRRNQAGAWALAWRCLSDSAEAKDVVQDAFLKIYRAASRYKPTSTFRTYLSRVVTRLCLDREAKKRPLYMDVLPQVADISRGPEALVIDAELRNAVRRCIARLPAHQRVAIVLRQYDGMSYDEIAEVLELSPKAVDSLLQRARDTLRKCLAAYRDS